MTFLHLMAGLDPASGVANIARRFARMQIARGDTAVLLAPAFKWNPIYLGLRFALLSLWQMRTADEIWVHCSWTFPVWYGAVLSKIFGRKLVVVPEASFDPKRMKNHAGWKKRIVASLDRWVLRQADEVLALCKDEIGWVKGFEPSARVRLERVPTFYEGVEIKSQDRMNRPLHVLFLGRAEDPLKGVEFLERAVAEVNGEADSCPLRDKDGRILTSGRDSASPLVELRVESAVFGEEKEKAWDWCDVLCLPTLSENFGLVVAEALEHGKRVITTDGAPAWDPSEKVKGDGQGQQWRDRVSYLRGYRDGTDEARVKLLKDALAAEVRA